MSEAFVVSIVIPTCNRAAFLRDALQSVQRQTARDAIGQVIVSENSSNEDSRAVCAEFTNIPVEFIQQKPPVPVLGHLKAMWERVQCPLVAFLHDDDWWAPWHLETALDVLKTRHDCSGVFANYYDTSGPSYPFQIGDHAWRVWLASDCQFLASAQMLDATGVMLCCLMHSTFHYSSLVGRRDLIWNAYLKVIANENAYDNDRTFPIFLSSYGILGYLTNPGVFVRKHPGQDCTRLMYQRNHWKLMAETTKMILATDPATVALAAKKFNGLLSRLDPHQLAMVSEMMDRLGEPQRSAVIRDCGFQEVRKGRLRRAKWLIRQCCPPGVVFGIREAARAFHKYTRGLVGQ